MVAFDKSIKLILETLNVVEMVRDRGEEGLLRYDDGTSREGC